MDEEEDAREDEALAQSAASMDVAGDADEDDGWTVVKPKKKH